MIRRMLSVFLLLLVCASAVAQHRKPCGTSVLTRIHGRQDAAVSRTRAAESCSSFLGEYRSLVILVAFPNLPFSSEDSQRLWNDIICREGYADHKAPGSVVDYFHDQSYGQFSMRFDVVGPVEVSQPYEYYGKDKSWGVGDYFDQNDGELVEEACRAVADSVSFADYDWNGDGVVEMVYILYAGYGETDYWQKDTDVIWPHMGMLSVYWSDSYPDALEIQGLTIDTYACSNELASNGKLAGHGTICHEFSHCLGLPDLYDTRFGNTVLGHYDLMDSGSYNDNGWCPTGYSSYERYACGWLTPEPVDDPHAIDSLAPLHLAPDVRIYRQHADDNPYYLIEYRANESWDRSLPSHGLMAWYIDYDEKAWRENLVNVGTKYRVNQGPLSIIPTSVLSPRTESRASYVYDVGPIRIVTYSDGTTKKVFR